MMHYKDQKNLQILQYLCHKAGRFLTIKEMAGVVFLADRYHLRRYGRQISYSKYYATEDSSMPVDIIELYRKVVPMKIYYEQFDKDNDIMQL